MMIDGTYFAINRSWWRSPNFAGHKMVLGSTREPPRTHGRQASTGGHRARGVAFDVLGLYVLDGGKGLHAAVRKMAGKCGVIQRCQIHKIRNVVDHLTEEYKLAVRL